MKVEDQVVSRELSMKLEKLGVKQESLFYWIKYTGNKTVWELHYKKIKRRHGFLVQEHFPAFTVAELGELLPYKVKNKLRGKYSYLNICKYVDNSWEVDCNGHGGLVFADKKLANAMAKMLIELIENKLINKELI